jgi:hypothetical protein
MQTKIVTKAKMHSGNVGKEIQKSLLKFVDYFSPKKQESANIIFKEEKNRRSLC